MFVQSLPVHETGNRVRGIGDRCGSELVTPGAAFATSAKFSIPHSPQSVGPDDRPAKRGMPLTTALR